VRWMNYWHQIDSVLKIGACNVLEVGKGIGLVSEQLKKLGVSVTTLDIDERLSPDIVASVESMPVGDYEFDLVLAAEVLEHLPWNNVPRALSEIRRATNRYAIVSLPFSGSRVYFSIKIPLVPTLKVFVPIPYFWKNHIPTNQHYWSAGTKDFSLKKIGTVVKRAGFEILDRSIYDDDFDHVFFTLRKA